MSSLPDAPRAVQFVSVDGEDAGQRIDNYLLRVLRGVPKTRIYRILRKGEVRVNKGRIKPDYRLCEGDVLRIPPIRIADAPKVPVPSANLRDQLAAAVLYEDEDLLAMNKPSGLAVHGGSGVSLGLIESLRQLRPDDRHLELVHRLDRDTSGCILISKRRSVLKELHRMLREGHIDKTYYALVGGHWPARRLQVNDKLLKTELPSGERIVRVSIDGKTALTRYAVLERLEGATLIEAKPVTGRTHQIRVHCQAAGYPILGDDKYGNDAANAAFRGKGLRRLFLHARRLEFKLNDKKININAGLSDDLQAVIKTLGAHQRW